MRLAGRLVVATVVALCGAPFASAQDPADEPAAAAKGIVIGEPGELGITAKVRPILPTIATGDPLRFALHFEKKDGPIDHSDPQLAAQLLDRAATLQTFEIAVKAPGGAWQLLKPEAAKLDPRPTMLYSDGTFLIDLTPDKLRTLNMNGAEELALPWKWEHKVVPGEYQFAVRGTLKLSTPVRRVQERGKGPMEVPATTTDVAFKSKPITIRVERADMTNQTLAELEEAAITALKEQGAIAAEKLEVKGIDSLAIADAEGNRVIRVRANIPVERPKPGPDGGIIIGPRIAGGAGYWQYEVTMSPAGKALSFGRTRKGFCVARGTSVDTPEGEVAVEKLHVGQQVLCFDQNTSTLKYVDVLGIFPSMVESTIAINGRLLRLTSAHPVYSQREREGSAWRLAGDLRIGDFIMTTDGKREITSVARVEGSIEVFDVAVAEPHNFFANGVLVHNKSIAWTPQHFVPWYALWNRAK